MRHNLRIEGEAFELRPIRLDDAQLVVELRGMQPERTRYLHPIAADPSIQRDWLERYFARPGDYYWVIERRGGRFTEGLIGLYDVDGDVRTAEWGRWVLRRGSLAAVESALMAYRAAFDVLKLDQVYCMTVADNSSVVSFHDSCGLRRAALLPAHFNLGGERLDAVRHECDAALWPQVKATMEVQARAIARRLRPAK